MDLTTLVRQGEPVRLAEIDPGFHAGLGKGEVADRLAVLGPRLAELTDLLFAAGMHSLLVVLQGRDTSGKDGVIRRLLTHINAQSCRVAPFKQPTPEELAHDFLWRVHAQTPARGSIVLFNRSHYEDVLVVRVHGMVDAAECIERYREINAFERALHRNGAIIQKFMLHISDEEQEERLLERESDVTKSWKLTVGDWEERKLWPKYEKAYQDALSHCSDDHAPWRIVAADHKWFRDLAIVSALVDELEPYRAAWMAKLETQGREQVRLLNEYRANAGATEAAK
jgi:PPK2 family polyphosphate:nucleotide phosphotransferase